MDLTTKQASAAHALASAYGHYWASPAAKGLISVVEIEAASRASEAAEAAAGYGSASGITAPSCCDGLVVHRTGGRRVEWVVDRAGVVTVTVLRACSVAEEGVRPVLRAEVYTSVGAGVVVSVLWDDGEPCARHVEQLAFAARALGCGDEEISRLQAKYPNAAPNQEVAPCASF